MQAAPRTKGLKFYQWNDGKCEIIRLNEYDEVKHEYEFYKEDGSKIKLPESEVYNPEADWDDQKWIKLNPDGIMSFFIVKATDNDGNTVDDVMVTLNRIDKKTRKLEEIPYAICRQSVIDIFGLIQQNRYIAGMTITSKTCPSEVDYSIYLKFDDIRHKIQVAVYMEDHLDDILKLVNTNKFDAILRNIKAKAHKMEMQGVVGYCSTLHELLKENYFMMEFRDAFNITEMDFSEFNLEDETTNKALTEYIMSNRQEVPVKFYPIKWDRTIYLEELERPYILVAPFSYKYPSGDITVLCYDVSNTISFKDIVNKGMSPSDAKREAMKQLGWK